MAQFAYLNIQRQKTRNIYFPHLNISNQLGKLHGYIYYLQKIPYSPVVSRLDCLFMQIMQIAQSATFSMNSIH